MCQCQTNTHKFSSFLLLLRLLTNSFHCVSIICLFLVQYVHFYIYLIVASVYSDTCRLACVAGPQFYGGPDFMPAKILPVANQAPHKTEGLPRRLHVGYLHTSNPGYDIETIQATSSPGPLRLRYKLSIKK